MSERHRPEAFARLRGLPLVGRAADWGLGSRAVSKRTKQAGSRIAGLEVTESVCPYCAVGCGQVVYTRDGELVDIEGNPRSPINQGTLCPKGSASRQLIQQPGRLTKVLYRRPHGTEWEELDLEQAMDMIAERVIAAREAGWQDDRRARLARRPHDGVLLAGRRHDRQRGELPHQEELHARWARCRSRTRPAYDTRARSPVWGPRSGAAAPPTSSRTSRTPTASGSRAPRWPRRTRSASAG